MRRLKLVLLAALFALGTATAGVAASTPAVPPPDSDCSNTICTLGNSHCDFGAGTTCYLTAEGCDGWRRC